MGEELALLGLRPSLPQRLGDRTQGIDHTTPGSAFTFHPLGLGADKAKQGPHAPRHVIRLWQRNGRRWGSQMGARQKAATGKGMDWPGMAGGQQRHHGIDHGQAGPYKQDRGLGGQPGQRIGYQGVMTIQAAPHQHGVHGGQGREGIVAGRDDRQRYRKPAILVEKEGQSRSVLGYAQNLACNQLEAVWRQGGPRIGQQVTQITAIQAAGDEAAGLGGQAAEHIIRLAPQPIEEMRGSYSDIC